MFRFVAASIALLMLSGLVSGLENDSIENAEKIYVGVKEGTVEDNDAWYSLDVYPYVRFSITFELTSEGSITAYAGESQEEDPFFSVDLKVEGDSDTYEHINEETSSKELFLMIHGNGSFSITITVSPGLDAACCCSGSIFLGIGGLGAAFLVLRRRK